MNKYKEREREICLGKLQLSGLGALEYRKFCCFINNKGADWSSWLSFDMEHP